MGKKCHCAYMVYIMDNDRNILHRYRVVGKFFVRIWQEYASQNGLRCEYVKE